jgi:glyoxylase-like metal-dependent hydrolase (beta-lactamase superfamily II)
MVHLKDIEKITDDLYVIRQNMRPGWFCSVIVIFGVEKIGIIDSGYENTPVDYIFPLLQERNRGREDVDLIVNTHRDGDHIRGNTLLKKQTKASIAIHNLEAHAVPSANVKLYGDELLELGDRVFKVIHTPGHRPGAICLLDMDNRLLITGDSVCGTREDLIRMEKEIYITSLRKLMNLDADMMIMSHPFMPLGKNVLKGSEIRKMIKESIKIAEQLS